MGKLTGYDINGSTQVPRSHSGVSDSENSGQYSPAIVLLWLALCAFCYLIDSTSSRRTQETLNN